MLHITGGFRSRNGETFTKATVNADCCIRLSISSSKTGDQLGWPLVRKTSTGEMACWGGMRFNLQAWIDFSAVLDFKALCIDGDLYVAGGI